MSGRHTMFNVTRIESNRFSNTMGSGRPDTVMFFDIWSLLGDVKVVAFSSMEDKRGLMKTDVPTK